MHKRRGFVYGTHYHRPPNPPREQHNFHLPRIKNELGFNLVKFRVQWNAIQRRPEEFDFAELAEMFDICDRIDLNTLVEINLETAPYWLERKYPETRYVSAHGHAIELGPYESTQKGGYPGLCFHNVEVREEGERFLRVLIRSFRDRKSLVGYDCWNEPHLEPAWMSNYWGNMGDRLYCYCEASKRAFREWLEERYADIEILNSRWIRAYGDWDDVNPPNRHGHYADWLDWIRFWFDSLSAHMSWRYRIIKEEDPGRFVKSHSGAVPPFLERPNAFINNWTLAAPVDIWGTSFSPKGHNWSLSECAGVMDASRSAARGKEFWISEMSGGAWSKRGFGKTPVTRPKDIRAWNWLSIVYGAKSIVYWQYLTECTGPEAGPGAAGLIKYNGEITERAREAARQASLIHSHFHVFEDYTPKTDVAILYDPDNSSLLFAMEGSDVLYVQSHIGYYRAIWESDLFARYLTYASLDDLKEKILIVPMCLTLLPEVAEAVEKFVQEGGILVADARMGLFDGRGLLQPDLPAYKLTEVAGLREDEALCSDPENRPWVNNPDDLPWPDEIYSGPEITVTSPQPARFRVYGYLAPLLLKGAECIGRWGDICLVARHKYGKGEVYYFGTYLGLALYNGDTGAFSMLSSILKQHTSPPVVGITLRPRLIENDEEGLLLVFNDDKLETHTDSISLSEKYKRAYDIMNQREIPIEDSKIELRIDPEDALVLRLSK